MYESVTITMKADCLAQLIEIALDKLNTTDGAYHYVMSENDTLKKIVKELEADNVRESV